MRRIAVAFTTVTALLAVPALQAKEKLTGEERLAKLLEGREAGEPVSCISIADTRDARIIDKTAIVYEAGNVIYVNRPRNTDALDDDNVMVTQIHGSQLCRLDTVQMHDRSGFWWSGFVGLENFVPYRRVATRD